MTITADQRLWSRVKQGPPDACWEWQGHRDAKGYGSIKVDGRDTKVHRLAYQLEHGPIPAGLVVMHQCDNPPCCNPNHLIAGTVTDNNRDRQAKGRTVMPTNGPDHLRSRTRCPAGHPYSGDNVRYRASGARRCAACYRVREAARRAAHRDEINARRRAVRNGA